MSDEFCKKCFCFLYCPDKGNKEIVEACKKEKIKCNNCNPEKCFESTKCVKGLIKTNNAIAQHRTEIYEKFIIAKKGLEDLESSLNYEKGISTKGYDKDMKQWLIEWHQQAKRIVKETFKNLNEKEKK